ncbi:MAG: hypothetical protein B7Z42_12060 [Brevundimonas sp. 12-68-7]|uniref:Uncharacterized protein n=1 Tax=Brevundimonas subvibrioides TaxID=74313 RepID=A0A258FQE8_9CAUL|nr:MAG: hypothetical protein B7Z42_12060 [Brevundimonas sp. 12-68-7]OYX34820.1 MAG: hypothetical protein B7Z01_04590 [Brevundimonas subvibrioides]
MLLRPDLIEEVNRMAAHYRSPQGQAEIAAMAKALRESPEDRQLQEDWESIADTTGWEWNEDR